MTLTAAKSMKLSVHIRWMIRKDMPAVQAIESDVFEFPWGEDDFIRCLRRRNCIGMVAELGGVVEGYMIYELHAHRLHLLSIAVSKSATRTGVAAAMVNKLKTKLSRDRRCRIMLEVRESNINAQLFFRAMGFRCVSVLRQFYEDTPEDGYMFQYRVGQEATA